MQICKYSLELSRFSILECYFILLSRSEYGAFWKCIQGGIIYAFTQLCKMLILATFFPANEASINTFSLSVIISKQINILIKQHLIFVLKYIFT